MQEKLIGYARLVAIAASQNQLGEEAAVAFCRDAVPQLLAEIEVLGRVNQKFEVALGLSATAAPAACEATVCSSRWKETPKAEKKTRKPRKKKARAK